MCVVFDFVKMGVCCAYDTATMMTVIAQCRWRREHGMSKNVTLLWLVVGWRGGRQPLGVFAVCSGDDRKKFSFGEPQNWKIFEASALCHGGFHVLCRTNLRFCMDFSHWGIEGRKRAMICCLFNVPPKPIIALFCTVGVAIK